MTSAMMTAGKEQGELTGSERTRQTAFVPRFDIWEGSDELILFGDLPGVTPETVDIRFENNQLSIHGKVCPRQEGIQLLCGEYAIGDFFRTFTIGEAIETAKIFAEVKDGVLTVHLPKSDKVKPRRIDVKAA